MTVPTEDEYKQVIALSFALTDICEKIMEKQQFTLGVFVAALGLTYCQYLSFSDENIEEKCAQFRLCLIDQKKRFEKAQRQIGGTA